MSSLVEGDSSGAWRGDCGESGVFIQL
jgi:hypothetical protein